MKLHRIVVVELSPRVRQLRRIGLRATEGAQVNILFIDGSEDVTQEPEPVYETPLNLQMMHERRLGYNPTKVTLDAMVEVACVPSADDSQSLLIPNAQRVKAERGITEMANLIATLTQRRSEIYSPKPYIMLEPENKDDRELLDGRRIGLPNLRKGPIWLAPGLFKQPDIPSMLADRQEGIALLASALAAGHGIAKLHELVRLFESAFATGGIRLAEDAQGGVGPLVEFLMAHPVSELGYTQAEVAYWINPLRDQSIHADRWKSSNIIMDIDVEEYLPRIEQAAYDVLFNKETWYSPPDPARKERWEFPFLNGQRNELLVVGGALAYDQMFSDLDHYGAFRLNPAYSKPEWPDEWLVADWGAKEQVEYHWITTKRAVTKGVAAADPHTFAIEVDYGRG